MTRTTDDRNDPGLKEHQTNGQQEAYLVLSAEERAKGFVRPLRKSYVHTACNTVTTMGLALCETYARDPFFYSGTFCCGCGSHYPLNQFNWIEKDGSIGPQVGS